MSQKPATNTAPQGSTKFAGPWRATSAIVLAPGTGADKDAPRPTIAPGTIVKLGDLGEKVLGGLVYEGALEPVIEAPSTGA